MTAREDPKSPGLVPVVVPELGFPAGEVRICSWLVEVGETVSEGDRLVELTYPGAVIDVVAADSGILERILLSEGTKVWDSMTIGWLLRQEPLRGD